MAVTLQWRWRSAHAPRVRIKPSARAWRVSRGSRDTKRARHPAMMHVKTGRVRRVVKFGISGPVLINSLCRLDRWMVSSGYTHQVRDRTCHALRGVVEASVNGWPFYMLFTSHYLWLSNLRRLAQQACYLLHITFDSPTYDGWHNKLVVYFTSPLNLQRTTAGIASLSFASHHRWISNKRRLA